MWAARPVRRVGLYVWQTFLKILKNDHLKIYIRVHNLKVVSSGHLKQVLAPKVIWEECVTVLIGYNGTPQFTSKTAFSPSTITTPSNIPISRPIQLTTPNGIWIQ